MPQNNLMGFALDMIQHNPALQNNPNAREMIDVIKSGDVDRGQQIARNLCNTYGVKPEDAIAQAKSFSICSRLCREARNLGLCVGHIHI